MKKLTTFICFMALLCGSYGADSVRLVPRMSYITDEPTAQIIIKTPSSHRTIEVPTNGFRLGPNSVKVKVDGQQRDVTIVRLAPKENQVQIDRLSGLVITSDKLPFIPCGFYCYSPIQKELISQEVVRGMNLYSPYQKIEGKTLKERLWYMDRCAQVGMKVNYNLLSIAGGGGVGSARFKGISEKEKLQSLDQEIKAIKDHPALLSWYIADEPEGQGMKPETLEKIYQHIKQADPYHPITVVIMSAGPGRSYAECCDIIMCDTYPVPNSAPAGVIDAVQGLYNELCFEKAIWYVPQTFGGSEWWAREPTAAEIRMMTWGATLAGARGFQAFVRHGLNGFPKNQSMWDSYAQTCRQIELLVPHFNDGESLNIDGSKEIFGKSYGKVMVIVNRSGVPEQFSVRSAGVTYEMFQNYTPRLFEGVMTDFIAPFGVNIYTTATQTPSNESNLQKDPSFENPYSVSAQQPSATYASVGKDPSANYFLDSRVAYHGSHSLRLITPSQGNGCSLSFNPMPLIVGKNYILTIWAKSDEQTLKRNPKGAFFRVNLGGFASGEFELTSQWKQYTINATFEAKADDPRAVSSSLTLISEGVAWFDLMEVVPDMDFSIVRQDKAFEVTINNHIPGSTIHYTLDGTEPSETSAIYRDTLTINKVALLKARMSINGTLYGVSEQLIAAHKALKAKVNYLQPYTQYNGGGDGALTDGQVAELRYKSAPWQGFIGNDMEVVLDLGKPTEMSRISSMYFHSPSDWIAPPISVEYWLSEDGINFESLGVIELGEAQKGPVRKITVTKEITPSQARYIKVKATGHHTMPAWHIGGSAWLFCDEIMVE
ncbi:MAG: FN3 associated domain-containing protein [Mucinivorans sp.]